MRHPINLTTKAQTHEVTQANENTFKVLSGNSETTYTITIKGKSATCTCKHAYWEYRKHNTDSNIEYDEWVTYTTDHPEYAQVSACSHTVKAIQFQAQKEGRTIKLHVSTESARKSHRAIAHNGDEIIITTRKN